MTTHNFRWYHFFKTKGHVLFGLIVSITFGLKYHTPIATICTDCY